MLKLKLTQEEFDQLDESKQSLYGQSDDGYSLQVDGMEDTGALKRAKDHEKEQRKAAESRMKELEDQLAELKSKAEQDNHNNLKEKGDYEALEKSFNDRLEKEKARIEQEFKAQLDPTVEQLGLLKAQNEKLMIDDVATRLAHEIAVDSDSAPILKRIIRDELSIEQLESGEFKTVIKSDPAKPLDEFKSEMVSDRQYSRLVKGSQATGSGATGANNGESGANQTVDPKAHKGDVQGFLNQNLKIG